MTFFSYLRLLSASCVAANLAVTPVQAVENTEVSFHSGQRISLVLPDETGADGDARQAYLDGLVSLTADLGLRQSHSFAVERVIIGDHQPQAMAIYSWPDAEQSKQLRHNSTFQSNFESLASQAWQELVTVDVDLEDALEITFDTDKVYTLAVAWIGDEALFESYVALSAPVREALGARPVMNLPVADFSSIQGLGGRSPDRVVIMEWNDSSHPDAYLTAPAVQNNQAIVQQAFEKIEWYELRHWEGY
ncbi:hypothetical protein QWI17_22875 [Gilvimarinus sp. SDUM040013]|uniref:DUF1330 domain-containing protein n=1 Tax=Gilvimarinus gilvus TaxID=3058038 RepID=A0ABU4RY66_9GAMM|nr:hypothetical protein [Gilvimarinus sp. SDUM040013]MDO3388709.1 hypothetical protein [Gilvimarinus sp. SDUM040013]MDX6849604.1 hypothetical protein [Gilvimarinus sp. SDUM040013]